MSTSLTFLVLGSGLHIGEPGGKAHGNTPTISRSHLQLPSPLSLTFFSHGTYLLTYLPIHYAFCLFVCFIVCKPQEAEILFSLIL